MPTIAPPVASVLPFAVLVYREEVDDVGPVWFASSIFTGHTTHGDSPEDAIEAIGRTFEAALELAADRGDGPGEWFARQRPCERERVEEFRRLAAGRARAVPRPCARLGCTLALHVVVRGA